MPWHPPCALSNLIVTNLSSCQRIAFAIFDSFFLLRPTAKLFAFLRAYSVSRVSQLVSLQDVFPSGCAVFKVQFRPSRFARWLPARIFQILCAFRFAFAHPPKIRFLSIPENDTGSRRRTVIRPSFAWIFFLFSTFVLLTAFAAIDLE